MNTERNKFLCEVVLQECWHERGDLQTVCAKCGNTDFNRVELRNLDFSSEKGFFKLWNFCKEKEWWNAFIRSYILEHLSKSEWGMNSVDKIIELINPDRFADAVYEFMKERR